MYNTDMAIDWTNIYKKYKGLWIALKDDEKTVLASGKTAQSVWDKARRLGYDKPILTRFPSKLTSYVGSHQ